MTCFSRVITVKQLVYSGVLSDSTCEDPETRNSGMSHIFGHCLCEVQCGHYTSRGLGWKEKDEVKEVGVWVERGEERQAFWWLLGRKLAWSSERGRRIRVADECPLLGLLRVIV